MNEPRAPWRLLFRIAARFLRGRGSHLLSGSARAALLATALGVFALVIAMALMSGYRRDLREKILSGSAPLIVYPLSSEVSGKPALDDALSDVEGITSVEPVVLGQGSLSSQNAPGGFEVTLRGVSLDVPAGGGDLGGAGSVLRFNSRLGGEGVLYPGPEDRELPGALLGSDLRKRLGVEVGDPLRLTALGLRSGRPKFSFTSLEVLGEFTTGFSEFDRHWMVLERSTMLELMGTDGSNELYEVTLGAGAESSAVLAAMDPLLGEDYLVTDASSQNRELFAALRWQQSLLFLVLGLIVLVSMFNVASTLVVLVRERLREIGVLSTMGLAPARLRWVFLLYAVGLTAAGTALGVTLGSLVAWVLNRFRLIRFDSEVAAIYFIDSVSFDLRWVDLASIVAFTLMTAMVACWAPASRAARVDPASALRHE